LSSANSNLRTILLVLAGLALAPSSVAAVDPPSGRCPNLGPIRVVSYKGQESRIFSKILATGEESTKRQFNAPEVLRILSECLGSLRASDEARELGVPALVGRIRVSVSDDAQRAFAGVDSRPVHSLPLSSSGARLAKTMIDRALSDLEMDRNTRAAAGNALWFLWIESYVRSLGNRHDSYRYADEVSEDAVRRLGRTYSVGFQPVLKDGRFYADEVFDDALHAGGLAPGSEILSVDQHPIAELPPPDLSRYWLSLRPFQYRVVGRSDGRPVDLVAQSVPRRFRTVAWTTQGDLAYVRISEFAVESVIELRRALRAIERAGMHALVIDLRSNRGGVASPGLIDCFLKPGQTTMSYRENATGKEVDLDATVEYHGIPLAVLVDHRSASMAETFAAAIQVHKRGVIVGTQTYGKGVGQTIHKILDEGTLHLVERTYFYPGSRESWDGRGLTPDIVVETTKEDAARVRALLESEIPRLDDPAAIDPVLRKALEVLGANP
jgi:carboxyl-terminal processing protease